MSIWRSPVFYFGVVLVLAVTAALAAPYLVPWNSYRSDLESFGEKVTGREVTIGGNIAISLFPWPQLEAQQVSIGNPQGFSSEAFVTADVVRVSLALAGLFNGSLNVESVDVEKPQVNLQRSASGDVNWIFTPQEKVTGQGLLSRVKLDQIVLSGGLVSFDDLRNGHSGVFAGVNGRLSAQSVLGPWRMQGEAKWNELPFGLVVTSAEKQPDTPLKFTVKLSPVEVVYPMLSLEGDWDGVQLKGAVRLDPQAVEGAKTSVEGALKPLSMQAQFEASTQRLSLFKLKIAPVDRKDSGTLIEGNAFVEFGSQATASVELKSPRVNLDTLLGNTALQHWRDGGFLKVANQLMGMLPSKLVADFSLNVSVLTSGGQSLNEVRLAGNAQREAIRVTRFAADFPGRSVGVFDGIVFPGEAAAQLGGKFKFESSDTRTFLAWLSPTWRSALEKRWTGSRGRLQVQSGTVDWSKDNFGLSDVQFAFEGSPGRAILSARSGVERDFTMTVEAGQLDLDSLMPDGLSFLRDGGAQTLLGLVSPDANAQSPNRRLILRAASVILNGVIAQEVAVDFATRASGFEIKLLDIGNVNGAHLKGEGSFVDHGSGPEGVANFRLDALDPRGFLRLIGLEGGDGKWTEALGSTEIDARITAVPKKTGPELSIDVQAKSGPMKATLVLTARDLERGAAANVAASGKVISTNGAALAKLLTTMPVAATGPADVSFKLDGSWQQGFAVVTTVNALDGVAKFEGTANAALPYLGLVGKLSATASDGQELEKAIGFPLDNQPGQPLDMTAVVATKNAGLSLLDVKGNLAGRRFSGQFELTADRRVVADFETDQLAAREVLTLIFMPWNGALQDGAVRFADIAATGVRGDIFIRPLQFDTETGDALKGVIVGFGLETGKREITLLLPGEDGLRFNLAMIPRGSSYDFAGSMNWPVDLERFLKTANETVLARGDVLLDGEFKATGSSPSAALAAMQGKGQFRLLNATLPQLTLQGFASAALAAQTPDALAQALTRLVAAPGTKIDNHIGSFEVLNGAVQLSSIAVKAAGLNTTIQPRLDLTSGEMNITTSMTLTARAGLPPVTISYTGVGGALQVRNGTSALAAKLGYELLSKEMAALERLQKEQEALAAKEVAQRKDDEQRFAAYQATRAELREQTRLRKFQASERQKRASAMQAIVDSAIKSGPAISRIELIRHARQLQVRRGLVAPPQP